MESTTIHFAWGTTGLFSTFILFFAICFYRLSMGEKNKHGLPTIVSSFHMLIDIEQGQYIVWALSDQWNILDRTPYAYFSFHKMIV